MIDTAIYIGIDIGTSGIRAVAIDAQQQIIAQTQQRFAAEQAAQTEYWWQVFSGVLQQLLASISRDRVRSIAVDGTSSTVMLTNRQLEPITPVLMYNDARAAELLPVVQNIAPADSPVCSATSALVKVLWLLKQYPDAEQCRITHQADWFMQRLCGRTGISDINNCLKTGYDAMQQCWPDWLSKLPIDNAILPQVYPPGSVVGTLCSSMVEIFQLDPQTQIVSGTTDSHAAVLATGINKPGQAVTSLGSTLVTKVISHTPVFNSDYGVHSQPFGEYWLVGGSSNSGGAVLKHYFTDAQIQTMTAQLDIQHKLQLDYYPLIKPGERFPDNDPHKQPRLTPRPAQDIEFFQAILEGISEIEYNAYQRLQQLGAPYPTDVTSVGGGSHNPAWTQLRQATLGVPVNTALHNEAAYGSALLARIALQQ